MLKNIGNLRKNQNKIRLLFLIFTFLLFISIYTQIFTDCKHVKAGSNPYTPESPYGITSGYTSSDYEYIIYTSAVGSSWIFDWGDNTHSSWIEVEESSTLISQYHHWDLPGVYYVKVKQRDVYGVESCWSPPLTITIESDFDGDGYTDEMEFSYNTNFSSSSSYPLDADKDGVPDDNSPDRKYIGDQDDDNDDLSDTLELKLGSNPKDKSDVKIVGINSVDYYLVDITKDGVKDIFYNPMENINTKIGINKDGLYLIDFDGNNLWDYAYDPVYGTISSYEEERLIELPMSLITVVGVVIAVVLIIFILFKTGVLYIYQEYVVVENKSH
jgi:hypothetical protein